MRTLLAGRSHMSSSMNNKSFLWWIYFEPLINFWIFPLPPWNRWGCCCLMGPACHPLRTVNVSFLGFCWPNDFWLIFSFDLLPPLKRWGRCWLMGPTCQPLWTINAEDAAASWVPHVILFERNVSFLVFFTNRFLVYFFFASPAAFKTLTTLLAHGSPMSASPYKKHVISWLFCRQ